MMKTKVIMQYQGKDVDYEDLVSQAKEYWKQSGKKIKAIKSLDIYVKPEEHAAYYAINNDEQTGRIDL